MAPRSRKRQPSQLDNASVVAVLADLAGSRRMSQSNRSKTQGDLDALMKHINREYRTALLAEFLVTLGDEFQGLLKTATVVPQIVQDVNERLPGTRIRIAISRGRLSTPLKKVALGTDGPVWYAARDLLTDMRKNDRYGAAFTGFGAGADRILNALAGLLTHQWRRLRSSQREIISEFRVQQHARKELASKLGVTQQALSNRARSSGYREYAAGLEALSILLNQSDAEEAI